MLGAGLSTALHRRSSQSVQLEGRFVASQSTVQRLAVSCHESLLGFASMLKQLKVGLPRVCVHAWLH